MLPSDRSCQNYRSKYILIFFSTAIISFPTGSVTSAESSFTSLSTVPTSLADSITSDPPVNSQFTFLSTATSLLVAPTQSSTSLSLSDPDAPTSTVSIASALPATAAPSVAALPSGLPARIFPASGVDPEKDDLDGYQFITLLFDQLLPWPWVCGHTETASQLFAYTPVVIQKSLNVTCKFIYEDHFPNLKTKYICNSSS